MNVQQGEVAGPALDVAALAAEIADQDANQWRASWRAAGAAGLLKHHMPIDHGGLGASGRAFVDAMVTFGRSVPDNGLTMGLNSHVWTIQQPLVKFGTQAQQERYLPKLVSGDHIGAFALTEPEAGSNALGMTTRAEKRDGGYVLNGAKTYIGMAPVCDMAIVFATTAPERGSWGVSAFIVESSDDGFVREAPQDKIGLKTLPMGGVRLDACWIPEDRRIGPEGAGARIIQDTLDWERCFILAPHVGAMERQLDAAADFAQGRVVFDQPISGFQSVSNRLADMRIRLETCRLLLDQAAQLYDTDQPLSQMAAITNLHISEAFLSSSLDAVRNFGGLGYLSGSQAGIDLNDALGGVIYSGTSDIQRQIVAKLELQKRRQKKTTWQ